MKKMRFLLIIILACNAILLWSQATVGVIHSEKSIAEEYTFFSPFSGTKAYIVDNCGRLINQWDRGTRPGLAAYFLENGHMFRTYKPDPLGPFTSASNAGGIERVDWNNNTLWKYEVNSPEQLSHHDATMLPNGNVLLLTWELTYRDELIELGRDPNQIATVNFMWSEKIIEVEPVGISGGNVVWQWHINDHYVQDFDPSKLGFGVVNEHPELFDINLPELNSPNSNASRDWNHFNSIDYNEKLDQILISVRNSDEIWIIDHSTTTEEASGHTGGNSGKGGDILYRWGNPSSYQMGTLADQQLFGQHGVHWIKEGLDNEGGILIFNNGNGQPGQDYSQVQILNPPISGTGQYLLASNGIFGPESPLTVYGDKPEERFYSAYLSNAQRLTNGNTLINAGSPGHLREINPEREIVWEYIIPLFSDTPATQGQNVSSNSTFRAYKFNQDYLGFQGLDLTPGLPIELNPLECGIVSSTFENTTHLPSVIYDGITKLVQVNTNGLELEVKLYNLAGQLLFSTDSGSDVLIDMTPFQSGLFLISLDSGQHQWTEKIVAF